MRHRVAGRKLNRTSSHRKALLRNLATQLLEHKRIHTTEAKAKTLRPYVEKLITKAKRALAREQEGRLPQGQKIDVHARRMVGKDIRNKAVLEELFDEIVNEIGDRPGGYTRIVKTYIKRGDSGKMAIIELVDYNTEQDGAEKKAKQKAKPTSPKKDIQEESTSEEVASDDIEEETQTSDEVTETEPNGEQDEQNVEAKEESLESSDTTEEVKDEASNVEVSNETKNDESTEDKKEN